MSDERASEGVAVDGGAGSDLWSRRFVADLIRNRYNARIYFSAPYLSELFADGFAARIVRPDAIAIGDVSPPLRIVHAAKEYFIPGTADDLVAYTSSVVACVPTLLGTVLADAPEDYGPPSFRQMQEGSCGRPGFMRAQWRRLDARTRRHLDTNRPVVVADIREFGRSVDTGLIVRKLAESGADRHALAHLHRFYSAWNACGAAGLPLTGCVSIMSKVVLADADAALRRGNVDFARIQDDYRLFADDDDDAARAVEALQGAIGGVGLSLNPVKTTILRPGGTSEAWRTFHAVRRLFRLGVARPLLGDLLRWRISRPLATRGLGWLGASQCEPFDRRSP